MPATALVLNQATPVIVLNAVSAANTAAATSSGIDLTGYEGVVVMCQQTGAITGTLDGVIQDSADNSSFTSVGGASTPSLTFAQVTAANKVANVSFDVRSVRRYIRYIGNIVTGPVLISVTLQAIKKVKG